MKKIIIIFLVILLCGCQTTNNHKVKTVKKTQDYQQLSKYEIIDFKIIDHNLIFVYKKNNQTYVYDYSIEKNKELLNTMIFDGPVNKAKIHVLQDIYAIQLTDTLFLLGDCITDFTMNKLYNIMIEFESISLRCSSSKILSVNSANSKGLQWMSSPANIKRFSVSYPAINISKAQSFH